MPETITHDGISLVTTAPAAITDELLIETEAKIHECAPIHTLLPIFIFVFVLPEKRYDSFFLI